MTAMQAGPPGQQTPPTPVLFDSSLDGGIDEVMVLAMLFHLQETRRIRGWPPAVTCMRDERSFRQVSCYRKVDSAATLTVGFHARDQ